MKEVEEATQLGLGGLLLFGIPAVKDEEASGAYAEDGIVQQALRAFKPAAKKLLLIADVCLCEYTSHGHCGIVHKSGDDYVANGKLSLHGVTKTIALPFTLKITGNTAHVVGKAVVIRTEFGLGQGVWASADPIAPPTRS